ncbi:hypothetical protein TrRE_jg6479 [Triparma retinervis]|uniref:Uncharacterized protein n=1 Tax=Triparma retinervis TaxID=2557542 RepID=A0A9W7C9I7_9STRA|nr:hypothetical protein TrRE_jg6479 [Triparma retinervis]
MEDHAVSVYIFATVVLLAYLSNFALTTSTVSTFKFVSIGPLITSDNDRDLSTSDLPYLTLSELAPPLYVDSYNTSKRGEPNFKYNRVFAEYDTDLTGLMFCPIRPGGPPHTVIMADKPRKHPRGEKLIPLVERYLAQGFCVITLNEIPNFPRDIFAPILRHLHDRTSSSLKVGILATGFNANFALSHLSEASRVFNRPSTLVKAVVSSGPIFSTRRLLKRMLEDSGIGAKDMFRAVLVDFLRPSSDLHVNLRLQDGARFGYRARMILGLAYGYANNMESLRDKADDSYVRFEIDRDYDPRGQAEEYVELYKMFPEERAKREKISFMEPPAKGKDHAIEALLFFVNQLSKEDDEKKIRGKRRYMPDGSLRISEKDEITLQRMESLGRKREGGKKTIIAGFTNDMFGRLLGF